MSRLIDMSGKRVGNLLVLHRVKDRPSGKSKKLEIYYRVLCDLCGRRASKRGYMLRQGRVKQCGCMRGIRHGLCGTPEYNLWKSAKHTASRRSWEFNIKVSDIQIPNICPLLEIPLRVGESGWATDNSASVDRINPNKGYVVGNVWVISKRANAIKNDATAKELKLISENLEKLWPSYT